VPTLVTKVPFEPAKTTEPSGEIVLGSELPLPIVILYIVARTILDILVLKKYFHLLV
jgi:hypothetical protein